MNNRTIKHFDDGKGGDFYIEHDQGGKLASMHYVHTGTTMIIIDHTEVDESLQGEGIGKKLLDATAEYARANTYRILATCPYALSQLKKYPDKYADVVR